MANAARSFIPKLNPPLIGLKCEGLTLSRVMSVSGLYFILVGAVVAGDGPLSLLAAVSVMIITLMATD